MHWLDPESEAAIERIAASVGYRPILLLVTFDPSTGTIGSSRAAFCGSRSIRSGPLPRARSCTTSSERTRASQIWFR